MTAADALRRLLADVEVARTDMNSSAVSTSKLLNWDGGAVLDYLERLALDGLAGEVRLPPCGLVWFCSDECALAGKHVKPTEDGQP